jgi:hypothetical protein
MRIHLPAWVSSPALLALACVPAMAQQVADPDFKPAVEKPAYVSAHPLIALADALRRVAPL